MDIEARRTRALEMNEGQIAAVAALLTTLEAITAPSEAQAYHAASVQAQRDILAALEASMASSAAAETAADFEAGNAQLGIDLAAALERSGDAVSNIPDEVRAALQSVNRCGTVTS